MQNEALIPAHECCIHYNIEYSFLTSLHQHGLLEVSNVEQAGFIPSAELQKLERLIRLHYELDINLEGIEAITYLLEKVAMQQTEMQQLRNRLSLFDVADEITEY